jgi:CheY-like chemotaxis protein
MDLKFFNSTVKGDASKALDLGGSPRAEGIAGGQLPLSRLAGAMLVLLGGSVMAPLAIVMLLDLAMPRADGPEVLRQAKGDERLRLVPVVMLTSSREEADLVKSYELGVNAYVVKSVGFQQFVDAIRQTGALPGGHQ